jgi:hypothetical protein
MYLIIIFLELFTGPKKFGPIRLFPAITELKNFNSDQPPVLMPIAHKFTGQLDKELSGRVISLEEKTTKVYN